MTLKYIGELHRRKPHQITIKLNLRLYLVILLHGLYQNADLISDKKNNTSVTNLCLPNIYPLKIWSITLHYLSIMLAFKRTKEQTSSSIWADGA